MGSMIEAGELIQVPIGGVTAAVTLAAQPAVCDVLTSHGECRDPARFRVAACRWTGNSCDRHLPWACNEAVRQVTIGR